MGVMEDAPPLPAEAPPLPDAEAPPPLPDADAPPPLPDADAPPPLPQEEQPSAGPSSQGADGGGSAPGSSAPAAAPSGSEAGPSSSTAAANGAASSSKEAPEAITAKASAEEAALLKVRACVCDCMGDVVQACSTHTTNMWITDFGEQHASCRTPPCMPLPQPQTYTHEPVLAFKCGLLKLLQSRTTLHVHGQRSHKQQQQQ